MGRVSSLESSLRPRAEHRLGRLQLWFGLLGGPIAWFLHLVASYTAVPLVCATGLKVVLYGIVGLTVAGAVAATLVAWRNWRRTGWAEAESSAGRAAARVHFMALSGVVLSAIFLFVIVVQSLPIFLQEACDPAGRVAI